MKKRNELTGHQGQLERNAERSGMKRERSREKEIGTDRWNYSTDISHMSGGRAGEP